MGQTYLPNGRTQGLYNFTRVCHPSATETMKTCRLHCLPVLLLIAVGCIGLTPLIEYHKLTNLTLQDNAISRNSTGLYPIEMEWRSNEVGIMHDKVAAVVLVGATNQFPMRRQHDTLLTNRWVAQVPVAATNNVLRYRIKVTWQLRGPAEETNSQLSEEYILRIAD